MKKKILFLFAILAGMSGTSRAFDMTLGRAYDKRRVNYDLSVAANTSTSSVIVSLKDTANWPHQRTGEIHVYNVRISADKVAASTASVELGVLNYVGVSTGSASMFMCLENKKNVSNTVNDVFVQSDIVYNLKVSNVSTADTDGATPYLITNNKVSGSANWKLGTKIPSVPGSTSPKAGDLILYVVNGAAAIDVHIELDYSTED